MSLLSRLLLAGWLLSWAAQSSAQTSWLSGPRLEQKLALSTQAAWDGTPIRQALTRLSRANGVAVLIDRRVDPDRALKLNVTGPLSSIFQSVARVHNDAHCREKVFPFPARRLGVTQVGAVIYVGPEKVAQGLRTICELRRDEARKLPSAARQKLVRIRAFQWDDLSTPKQLFDQLSGEAATPIAGAEKVPHDLWAAADLPPLTFVDRLALVAAQFDLTFNVDPAGNQITLRPVTKDDLVIERSHPGGKNSQELAERWRKARPEATVRVIGSRVVVRGRAEDHDWIQTPAAIDPKKVATASTLTSRVQNKKIGDVINELSRSLGLTVSMDKTAIEAAGISLDKRVSFQVKDATVDQLFQAALKPAGLTHRLIGKVLEVKPAGSK